MNDIEWAIDKLKKENKLGCKEAKRLDDMHLHLWRSGPMIFNQGGSNEFGPTERRNEAIKMPQKPSKRLKFGKRRYNEYQAMRVFREIIEIVSDRKCHFFKVKENGQIFDKQAITLEFKPG